ncbi:MAG: CpXC domain-containing protein, partial [Pseudomonadota bacterium]
MPRSSGSDVYAGLAGKTRREKLQYSCPCGLLYPAEAYFGINATRDPALGARLQKGLINRFRCPGCGAEGVANVPVVFHDEEHRLLVLLLPESLRHRELEERAALLLQMADDRSTSVPRYACEFVVAYGTVGLSGLLHGSDEDRDRSNEHGRDRDQDTDRNRQQDGAGGDGGRDWARSKGRGKDGFGGGYGGRDSSEDGGGERRAFEPTSDHDLTRRRESSESTEPGVVPPKGAGKTQPSWTPEPSPTDELWTAESAGSLSPLADEDRSAHRTIPEIVSPLAGQQPEEQGEGGQERDEQSVVGPETVASAGPAASHDVVIEKWMLSRAPSLCLVDQGKVRLLATLDPSRLERFLGGNLAARIQLFRAESYPVVALGICVDGDPETEPIEVLININRSEERSILALLATAFRASIDLFDHEYLPVFRAEISACLETNTRFVITAAEEHLASIPGSRRSFDRASSAWHAEARALQGTRHGYDLEEDSFALLPTASAARRALSVVAYWNEPQNEEHLVLIRSFPLDWWQRIRSRVVARAVELGLAMPSSLVEIALNVTALGTRRELVARLAQTFSESGSSPPRAGDLKPD